MNRLPMMTITIGFLFAAAQSRAADPTQPGMSKRQQQKAQLTECMKKRMFADQTLSYNAATKTCKSQIAKQSAAASGALVASDTPAKQQ
jgi:hypothetical protein